MAISNKHCYFSHLCFYHCESHSTLNGVLEMDGFKETFRELYITNCSEDGSGSGYSLSNVMLNSSSSFCDDGADNKDASKTCGSGNGADSATLIVSHFISYCRGQWLKLDLNIIV